MTSPSEQSDTDEIRLIEAQAVPTRFARGWHCLGLVRDFGDGKPHSINAFGQTLVVFRGGPPGEGNINVLDGYCRHMGGDLSQGEVKGNEIACPFHDWRWGGDGRCKLVPYARRTPRLARTAAWTTLEQDGMLFVWNDPERKPPPPEVTIPRIEGAISDDWTDWHWYTTIVGSSNCREIIDNVVDMAHFFYIHGALPTYFKNIFEGHVATQYMNGEGRPDLGGTEGAQMLGTTSKASYYGPSFMIDDLIYHYEQGDHRSILINCHYPIDANSFVLQYGIIVKKSETLPDDLAVQTAITLGDYVKLGFEQDVEIWRHKARIDNPLLVEEDGPVYQLRRWYQQFYVDVADVQPDMVDRFEYGCADNHRGLGVMTFDSSIRDDNRLDEMPMVPVVCRNCGARVLARKSSWNQTSVQWNADAAARCAERAEAQKMSAHASRGVFLVCSALSESIVDAVRHGDLSIVEEITGVAI